MDLIETWRALIRDPRKSWVLFQGGTVVVFGDAAPELDLASHAAALLAEWGPVHAGTPAGDFQVIHLRPPASEGWVVTSHHPDVLTWVGPEDVGQGASELAVGLTGRGLRDEDARRLLVLHVEDRRGQPG